MSYVLSLLRRRYFLQTVAVVGVGLIGGSLGLAFKARGWHVIGIDSSVAVLNRALQLGAIDEASADISSVRAAELVILATPLETLASVFQALQGHLTKHSIVTDVGSVKEPIVLQIEEQTESTVHYIGGHPMFGSADQGIEAASAQLVGGAPFVLTPTKMTNGTALTRLSTVLGELGMKVIEMSPQEHDRAVAVLSHLPYLIGVSLTDIGNRTEISGPSFRGATRVAGSPIELWISILRMNRPAIEHAVKDFIRELENISRLDGDELKNALETARKRHLHGLSS